jgi:hypothetical protein
MMPYSEATTGTISPENEHAYKNERAYKTKRAFKRQAHEPFGAAGKPCDVLVNRAPLRGLTPEVQENASGKAVHPTVV